MAEPALPETDIARRRFAVRLRGVTKVYDNGVTALGPLDLDVSARRIRLPARAVRLRQVDRAAADRGAERAEFGHGRASPIAPGRRDGRHSIGFVFQEPTLMPWASVRDNVRLPLKLAHAPAAEADARVAEALAQVGLAEFADAYPARIVRRHEDAGVAGARAGHRSGYSADGRAVRSARRDHALPAQQRSARAVAQAAQDRHLRHPFGVRVGLSVAARDRDDGAARPHQPPSFASTRRSRATRISGPRPTMPPIAARSRARWRRPIPGSPGA